MGTKWSNKDFAVWRHFGTSNWETILKPFEILFNFNNGKRSWSLDKKTSGLGPRLLVVNFTVSAFQRCVIVDDPEKGQKSRNRGLSRKTYCIEVYWNILKTPCWRHRLLRGSIEAELRTTLSLEHSQLQYNISCYSNHFDWSSVIYSKWGFW